MDVTLRGGNQKLIDPWEEFACAPSEGLGRIHLLLADVNELIKSEPVCRVGAILHARCFIHLKRQEAELKDREARSLTGVH